MNNDKTITAYKGFDKNMRCRDMQYEVGKTYEHDGDVEICRSGFHACEYPLDIFSYYDPASSKFAVVEMKEHVTKYDGDSKIAAASIHIIAEITIPEIVSKAIDWITNRIDPDRKQSSTGNRSAANNTGYRSAASSTGDWSAANNTGNWSAASNTGYRSAASVEGTASVAMASGRESKAKACEGSAIVLCNYDDDGNLRHIKSAIVGDGIKADTWYMLNDAGEFEEVA